MKIAKLKKIINNHTTIFKNFTYISILEIFILISPLITYPYLVRTLGSELYGLVITAQVIASYAAIVVNFGFRRIGAKDISIYRTNREKLSETLSTIFTIRFILWCLSLAIYLLVIKFVPIYNEHFFLFLFSFGITLNDLLFPQFFFQGIEKMKFITFINIGITTLFIILVFTFIKDETDYYLVPLLKTVEYFLAGIISLFIIFFKEKLWFTFPTRKTITYHIKEALPIFSTEIISTIKDKFSYILLGSFVGMQEVVIYNLGSKFTTVLVKPASILSTVLFPKIANERNINLSIKVSLFLSICMILLIFLFNIILPYVVPFFLPEVIDLLPLRIFLLAPLFLSISSFLASNNIIALGYNKYILYSIIVTTIVYVIATISSYYFNILDNILVFIIITVLAYFVELIYRIYVSRKIIKKESLKNVA